MDYKSCEYNFLIFGMTDTLLNKTFNFNKNRLLKRTKNQFKIKFLNQ